MPEPEISQVTIPTPPRSRGRKLAIFAGLLLLMLACVAGSYFYVTIAARNSLQAALAETDRLDSAQLSLDDVLAPKGYILIGYTLDPRTGLGAFRTSASNARRILASSRSLRRTARSMPT